MVSTSVKSRQSTEDEVIIIVLSLTVSKWLILVWWRHMMRCMPRWPQAKHYFLNYKRGEWSITVRAVEDYWKYSTFSTVCVFSLLNVLSTLAPVRLKFAKRKVVIFWRQKSMLCYGMDSKSSTQRFSPTLRWGQLRFLILVPVKLEPFIVLLKEGSVLRQTFLPIFPASDS